MLVLSEVTAGDAPLLTRIIRQGKAFWGYSEEWLDAWANDLAISPEQIAAWHVRTASVDGELIGFFALVPREGEWWLEHLWLVVEQIGRGHGGELFRQAMAAATGLGVERVRIEADPNAEGFYLHMGARRDGERVSMVTGTRRVIPRFVYDIKQRADT